MVLRRIFLGAALAFNAAVSAQEALNAPVPLAPFLVTAKSNGVEFLAMSAARRAQELGFDSVAAGIYRDLLTDPRADHGTISLALATVLLDAGQAPEAEQALNRPGLTHDSAWHLRAALTQVQQRKFELARGDLAATKIDDLSVGDRAWWYYVQGVLAEISPDPVLQAKANDFFVQAEARASTPLARARIQLGHDRSRLRAGAVNEQSIEQTRQNVERNRGRGIGYDFARSLAVMLDSTGRRNRALEVLQDQLRVMPPEERARADDFRLLIGLIGGAGDPGGRAALVQLVESGSDPAKQRMGLQLLARNARGASANSPFRTMLDRLIASGANSPIYEDLLLFRAQDSLGAKTSEGYTKAEDDAQALLQKFPASPQRAYAYGVLTSSAWDQKRYRLAANYAGQAREALAPGDWHAEFGVVIAEAWFRAGKGGRTTGMAGTEDFRNAADAYAAALKEVPPRLNPGELIYQRVLSEIEAGSIAAAEPLVDQLSRSPADAVNRWQAEWNLARALQINGRAADAYARVGRLLNPKPSGAAPDVLPPSLRAQLLWLQARLSLDVGQPEETARLVASLQKSLEGIEPAMRAEISSTAALLAAQADFALKRDREALGALAELRRAYPRTDAYAYSYIIEAEHAAAQDRIVEAQQLLTKLADDFSENKKYAPYALYQAALQAEKRGQTANFEEANKLIERLAARYPDSDLVFYARLKQGALLEKLNYFSQAQTVFESLTNNFAQHQDVILAQLALAECHNAQSASEPAHAEIAQVLFEHLLYDRLDAPVDVRVEAGFNLGAMLALRGNSKRALEVWWKGVVDTFLLAKPSHATELGSTGRYWMARTLLRCGDALEKQENLDEARNAWLLLVNTNLPGQALARQQLARYNLALADR